MKIRVVPIMMSPLRSPRSLPPGAAVSRLCLRDGPRGRVRARRVHLPRGIHSLGQLRSRLQREDGRKVIDSIKCFKRKEIYFLLSQMVSDHPAQLPAGVVRGTRSFSPRVWNSRKGKFSNDDDEPKYEFVLFAAQLFDQPVVRGRR
jgi:hypothetical protein